MDKSRDNSKINSQGQRKSERKRMEARSIFVSVAKRSISTAFSTAHALSETSEMVLSLGTLEKESPCTLCRFFYSVRRPRLTGEITSVCHLRKYQLGHLLNSGDFPGSTLWAVDPGSEIGSWTPGRDYDLIANSIPSSLRLWFFPQSLPSDYFKPIEPWPYPQPTLKGLPVNETSVNYSLLRGWITECEGHHICKSSSSILAKPQNSLTIRGIDCTNRKIVCLRRPGDKYIALSYVWGNKSLPEEKGKPSNSYVNDRALPTITPKVVEDATVVVREPCQQYLWVDQYRIDQHDEQDKHAQIRNMDHIYEGAHATIVAFPENDSSCGLPAVTSERRNSLPRFKSPKISLVCFIPGLTRQSLEASTWMKRGWTFQEALLSRRLLIFGREQISFHCPSGVWVEGSTPRPRMLFPSLASGATFPLTVNGVQATMAISPLKRRSRHLSDGFYVLMDVNYFLKLIQGYSRRQLRFQADALDAV